MDYPGVTSGYPVVVTPLSAAGFLLQCNGCRDDGKRTGRRSERGTGKQDAAWRTRRNRPLRASSSARTARERPRRHLVLHLRYDAPQAGKRARGLCRSPSPAMREPVPSRPGKLNHASPAVRPLK